MCLSSDITTMEVMWYCKIRWVDMPGGVPETRNESAWRHCPEHLHRNVLCERLFHPVGTIVNWADDVTHFTELFAAWLCTAVHWDLLVSLHILKEMVTSNAIKKIALCNGRGEFHVGCLEPAADRYVYWHKQVWPGVEVSPTRHQ
jgi:hypothetical protein